MEESEPNTRKKSPAEEQFYPVWKLEKRPNHLSIAIYKVH